MCERNAKGGSESDAPEHAREELAVFEVPAGHEILRGGVPQKIKLCGALCVWPGHKKRSRDITISIQLTLRGGGLEVSRFSQLYRFGKERTLHSERVQNLVE